MKTMSLIVPCYNEEPTIEIFFDTVEKVIANDPETFKNIKHNYLFINDGSSDETLNEFRKLNTKYPDIVHYISFSRNFGKEAGLAAGLQHAEGDYVAVMDVDLQDPPELLPKMLQIIQKEQFDCVGTMREDRTGEPPIRSFFSRSFYAVINKVSKVQIIPNARDYRLMTRQMVDAILELPEYNRFSKGIFNWVGFKTTYLKFENAPRSAGETHWSFWQLFNYSIEAIVDFSDVPLKIATLIGLLFAFISIISIIFVIIRKLLFGDSVGGWASLVSILLFVGGVQLFCMGIIGNYIGKIYLETKHRPQYIVQEKK
ncbi:glycosyltransferase family 2 protein [Lactiplantibacillus mudanjiangensis]|uniref:Glycosyltransferase [Lactobacillus sp.] n=1 Tax=Lactiplantibacillus mudanjiangensis TaxID=1296538 RepID=A0A660EA36_9LACO|nr:glycosyltransferase family 2 protein [Lactiplantibacillus mudanjiangensis]VDG23440.1 glycosyltransferase [Lactobacillus sp.] [Lactiplantibacillus mudanjiangensis]VDG29336.1 glycosyltransferase [Lactobacillus sp.] [Lactiplantibacillus mudanjiangensis]